MGAVSRRGRLAVALVVAALALSGCLLLRPPEPDGVLWRQVAAQKDPFMRALLEQSFVVTAEGLAAAARSSPSGIPGLRWSSTESPEALELARGATVVFDVVETPGAVRFGVMFASGPRNAEADPLADAEELRRTGPGSYYSCLEVAARDREAFSVERGLEGRECPPELVAELGDDAQFWPIETFSG